MGQIQTKQRMYDAALVLESGAAGNKAANFSYPAVVDLGTGHVAQEIAVDISVLKISANNELYRLIAWGSDDSGFAAGSEVELGGLVLGAMEVIESDIDSLPGRHFIKFDNVKDGAVYRYVKLRLVTTGTAPSITITQAFITPLHR